MAQRTSLNDLILPNMDIPGREAELTVLPSIDVKKISQSGGREQPRKRPENKAVIDLIDFKCGYESNILRNKKTELETIASTKINWPSSNDNPEEKTQQRAKISIPKINNKRSPSQLEDKVEAA